MLPVAVMHSLHLMLSNAVKQFRIKYFTTAQVQNFHARSEGNQETWWNLKPFVSKQHLLPKSCLPESLFPFRLIWPDGPNAHHAESAVNVVVEIVVMTL